MEWSVVLCGGECPSHSISHIQPTCVFPLFVFLGPGREQLKQHLDQVYNAGSSHRVIRRALAKGSIGPTPHSVTEVLQALVKVANESLGHHAVIHYATAAELNAWQLEGARSRFKTLWKAQQPGKRCPAFDARKAGLVPFTDVNPVTGEPNRYVKGWSLVPSYMKEGLQHFPPVTAADACFGKNKAFPSTFYVEASMDANSHVHAVCVSHLLGSECAHGYNIFAEVLHEAYNGFLQSDGRAMLIDGGTALKSMVVDTRPKTAPIRCHGHLLRDLTTSNARAMFERLRRMPPHRRDDVRPLNVATPSQSTCSTAPPKY